VAGRIKRVAVEDALTNVEQALRQAGYDVTKMTGGTMSDVDAAIITGMSNDFMGFSDTRGNKIPVVEANGMSAQDVVEHLQRMEQRLS
jgi:hypothetical protein